MTNETINRRMLVKGVGSAGIGALAGCNTFHQRSLGFWKISGQEFNQVWQLEMTIVNDSVACGQIDCTFTNVSVVGYTKERQHICQTTVGDVPADMEGYKNRKDVQLVCDQLPYILTLKADQSPCDTAVDISVVLYRGKLEGDHHWSEERSRECGEGLPPEISTEDY